jgi:hypothetical protein
VQFGLFVDGRGKIDRAPVSFLFQFCIIDPAKTAAFCFSGNGGCEKR